MFEYKLHRSIQKTLIVGLTIIFSVAGCTNRALYDSVQLSNIRRCQELPIPQQTGCEAQYQISFDEYSRQRSELLDKPQE